MRAPQDLLVVQRIGDVFGDGQRIEQAALLKQNPDPRPQIEQVLFAKVRDLLPEQPHLAGIGLHQPHRHFKQHSLPAAGGPEDHIRLAGVHFERHAIERHRGVEMQADVLETQDGGIVWHHGWEVTVLQKRDSTRK